MTSPPSLLSSMALLPALSVVLGMPLCQSSSSSSSSYSNDRRRDDYFTNYDCGDDDDCGASQTAAGNNNNKYSNNKYNSSNNKKEEEFAKRAKDNISRIYARRMMIRAQLERRHPWGQTTSTTTTTTAAAAAGRRSAIGSKKETEDTTNNDLWQDAKQKLLSDTLLSVIQLKYQHEQAKSLISGSSSSSHDDTNYYAETKRTLNNNNNNNDNDYHHHILPPPKIIGNSINNNSFHHHRIPSGIAICESPSSSSSSPSAAQKTLDEYNALSSTTSSTSTYDIHHHNNNNKVASLEKLKPAEWNADIDLAQRRLEFGQEISPLSNTTRWERWGMAWKRMMTLGALVAPLGVLVPGVWVLGGLVGDYHVDDGDGDNDSGGDDHNNGGNKNNNNNINILQRYHQHLTKSTWSYALWAVEQAGPTYIKLVQWASTRNDLFSPEFVGHFSKLQDETRGHAWRDTEVALEKAFGGKDEWRRVLSFDRVLEEDDYEDDYDYGGGSDGGGKGSTDAGMKGRGSSANRERQARLGRRETLGSKEGNKSMPMVPIGSGCVAQVYKARLRTSHGLHPAGTSVAVKVQHPHILEKVCLDFYIMNKFCTLLERIPYLNLDYLSMKDSVDQFRDIMLPQLDLRVEAHNLQRFRRDFEGETQIAFPEPLMDLTSREVLVERFVEGEPMLNFVKREDEHHSRKDREELATIGLKTVMKMIFLNDFIHADLHPGNMIVDRNKSARGHPLRIHMIDCGLTVELGERDHVNMVKILGSLIKRDGYSAGKLMVDTAKKCQATEMDVELFCRGINKICEDDEDNNFLESVGDYITDICYLACKHKVKLEAAFINAALACEIMEGLAASLYPEMRVQQVALPLVLKAEMMHGLKGLPSVKIFGMGN